ncbi:MAG TPA: hypothetical protein VGP45_05315, partial [Marinobacter sp.]|nr:hypothetical protein [Marinobacter sp.]
QANQPATKEAGIQTYSAMPLPGELQWSRYYDPVQNVPLINASSRQQLESALWFNRQYLNTEFGAWPRDLLREHYPDWRIKNNL